MASNETLSTSMASDESFGVSMEADGTEATYEDGEPVDLNEELDGAGDEDLGEDNGQDDNGDSDEDSGELELEDLGDFDPNDTERWDAQYKTADGQLNEEALSAEFWKNGRDKGLNEGTYKYLESLGISRQMAKNVEAALVTKHDAAAKATSGTDQELFTLAGGPDKLQAALNWGKQGGYTKEQRARFDKVMKGKDAEAKREAVEALMSRYGRANPNASKPRLPKRDATKGQGQPQGMKPFASREEYRAAKREAGSNQRARRLVAQRLAISEF